MCLKRFMVFVFETYYPNGGMDDFVASFDDRQDAWDAMKRHAHREDGLDNYQLYDSELNIIENYYFDNEELVPDTSLDWCVTPNEFSMT